MRKEGTYYDRHREEILTSHAAKRLERQAYMKKWRAKNKERELIYSRHYEKNRRCRSKDERKRANYRYNDKNVTQRRAYFIELLGGKCLNCPVTDRRLLCFDHVDPNTKKFQMSGSSLARRSLESIKEEVAKCQLLCHNCHFLKTLENGDNHIWRKQKSA